MKFPKLRFEYQIIAILGLIIILIAIFFPRSSPLITAGVSAHLGNLGGKIELEALTNQESQTLAWFYAPWCGHCQRMEPEWDKLTKINDTDVILVKINCDERPDLAKKFKIESYPTIYFLPKGLNNPRDLYSYDGERTGERFLAFIREMKDRFN